MNIALIGYGKMGREIEQVAQSRGHRIAIIIDEHNQQEFTTENLKEADVAIEFTNPEAAFNNYLKCFKANIPVVSGTTGWLDKLDQIKDICHNTGQGFFYASNFSLGVNLFFELNRKLTKLITPFSGYQVEMEETHHVHKLDAPSGTAITLAEDILKNHPIKKKWVNYTGEHPEELGILSKRRGATPGTHSITWHSDTDEITIQHLAYNRKGFAIGAVLAAEFMPDKKGFFSMTDLLKL